MEKYIFPWDSQVMINYPWVMPVFMLIMGIVLSIISWINDLN